MFTKSMIKMAAIAHYQRMIEWAERQPPDDIPENRTMGYNLGEYWGVAYCRYCISRKSDMECDLGNEGQCNGSACCSGSWVHLSSSLTWGEWIECAERVLEHIWENGRI